MAEIIYDCPRCGVKKTSFDINGQNFIGKDSWRTILELYSICRHCHKGTIFIVKQINSNRDITKLIQNSGNVISNQYFYNNSNSLIVQLNDFNLILDSRRFIYQHYKWTKNDLQFYILFDIELNLSTIC